MNTDSGVSSIVIILCKIRSPTCFKVCKFIRQHCNRRASMTTVKKRCTKREYNFLITLVDSNVCRVPLLTFRRLWTFWSWFFFYFGWFPPALTFFFHWFHRVFRTFQSFITDIVPAFVFLGLLYMQVLLEESREIKNEIKNNLAAIQRNEWIKLEL